MDMKKRRDMQLAYISDETVMEEQVKCRKILQKLNFADRSDFDGIAEMVKENRRVHVSIRRFTAIMVHILKWGKISLQIITVPLSMWQK